MNSTLQSAALFIVENNLRGWMTGFDRLLCKQLFSGNDFASRKINLLSFSALNLKKDSFFVKQIKICATDLSILPKASGYVMLKNSALKST